jgi:hypothetical protein
MKTTRLYKIRGAGSLALLGTLLLAAGCGGSADSTEDGQGVGGSGGGTAGKGGASGAAGKGGASGTAGTGGAAGKAGGSTGGAAGKGGTGGTAGKGGASGGGGAAGKGGGGTAGKGGAGGGTAGGGGGVAGAAGKGGAAGMSGGAGSGAAGRPGCKTCESEGINCGPLNNGCGQVIPCGDCPAGQTCGGNGTPSVCGAPMCTPKTCDDLGLKCGPAGDGCNGALDCGACPAGETCGGNGTPGVCGAMQMCQPKTCAEQGISCGPAGDGCGGPLECGSCPASQPCGGGGTPGVCGAPVCTPQTCGSLNYNCGPAADGCGGLLQCGACALPQTCGGLQPSVCGVPASCTGLCLQQTTCPNAPTTTTVSGRVFAPNGTDALPNVLVYVPNGPVQPFTPGVSCDNCGTSVTGNPLVKATSGLDGSFTLSNVPVGANIPLVIQIGRWRRQVTIANVAGCQDNPIPADITRLPRTQSEGDIPLMAFATGKVDALECVMRKIGVADAEFTKPDGGGRIQFYLGSGAKGANAGKNTPSQDTLVDDVNQLSKYDIVLFPCQGMPFEQNAGRRQNLVSYMNAGGRLFATHFSYVWLYDNTPFDSTAKWNPNKGEINDQTGYIDQSFPKGQALSQWLVNVGASTTLGQIPIQVLRHDVDSINNPPGQLWMSVNDPKEGTLPMHYTFNTPVGAAADQQCGRVVFDDFHVENSNDANTKFPNECDNGPMTPQEKLLEFMIFDLSSCVAPDVPSCTPKACGDLGIGCGPAGDGCGNPIDCGACPGGQTCGGGGVPNQCGTPMCTPQTCLAQGLSCGPAGDGCGNPLDCGNCPAGQTCGGGGKPGVCGSQVCTPVTCDTLGYNCGPAGDGCGNPLNCGMCPAGQTCGGGGKPGVCGAPSCTPKTCTGLGLNCGPAADGCGGLLQCGNCAAPQTCGGGGTPNVCGGSGKP